MCTIGSVLKEIKNCRKMINVWKSKQTSTQEEQKEQQRQIIAYYEALQWQAKLLNSLAEKEIRAEKEFAEVLEPSKEPEQPKQTEEAPAEPKQKKTTSKQSKQFKDLKAKHPDTLLLFRVGDFYESYYDDAKACAEVLGITLTKRDKTDMAGFPHHALDTYLPKLIRAGKRVAIFDQLEEPKKTVKRATITAVKKQESTQLSLF